MIEPPPAARMCGMTSRASVKCARTLIRHEASMPRGSTSSSEPSTWMPAWLCRMSMRPNFAIVRATSRSSAASSPTSVATASAVAAGRRDAPRRLLARRRVAVRDDEPRAFARHDLRAGAADAGARAGDDRHALLQGSFRPLAPVRREDVRSSETITGFNGRGECGSTIFLTSGSSNVSASSPPPRSSATASRRPSRRGSSTSRRTPPTRSPQPTAANTRCASIARAITRRTPSPRSWPGCRRSGATASSSRRSRGPASTAS